MFRTVYIRSEDILQIYAKFQLESFALCLQ